MGTGPDFVQQRRHALHRDPGFRLFLAQLHLDHHLQRLPHFVQPPRQLRRVNCLDHVEQLTGLAGLVRLQMPDEVEPRVLQMLYRRLLALKLLHVVLAEVAQPHFIRLQNHLGGENLRHPDQRDFLPLPPAILTRAQNSLFYLSQVLPKHHYYLMANEVADQVLEFVARCAEPAVLEAGEEPLVLEAGRFSLDVSGDRVFLEAWDGKRNLTRRLTRIVASGPGRLEIEIQRLGRRPGLLLVVDRARPTNQRLDRRARRWQLRERLRRLLARQFNGWTISDLTVEPDLQHTLSPAYARAMIKRGVSAWAALAAPADPGVADAALSFGLIWLDYLRRREPKAVVEGLCLLLPAGCELTTCLRLRWLHPRAAQFATFLYDVNDWEESVDWRVHGNLHTRIEPASGTPPSRIRPASPESWLEAQVRRDITQFDPRLRTSPVYGQVPAWAAADRGVLDLLAVDHHGRLAVVELKATADPNLPLQALDYWLRVDWHNCQGDFARQGYFPDATLAAAHPRLTLIAPALQFHPTTETILRCLAPEVEVERIGVAVEWQQQEVRVLFRLQGAQSPR